MTSESHLSRSYSRIKRSDGAYLWPGGIAGNSFGSIEHATELTDDLAARAVALLTRLDAEDEEREHHYTYEAVSV